MLKHLWESGNTAHDIAVLRYWGWTWEEINRLNELRLAYVGGAS